MTELNWRRSIIVRIAIAIAVIGCIDGWRNTRESTDEECKKVHEISDRDKQMELGSKCARRVTYKFSRPMNW